MRIQILSDLHMECRYYRVNVVEDVDALVFAGDFTTARCLGELRAFAKSARKPVMFVAGNHDYYYGIFNNVNKKLEQIDSNLPNFHFLNNRCVEIDEVRFIGSTLWSNFDLAPNPGEFAVLVGNRVSDFLVIKKNSTHAFSPYDCWELNERSRRFLRDEIDASFSGKRVVVTHFLPSPKSIHAKFEGDLLNPYFCCDCEDLMGQNVPLWIHGHTHESTNFVHKGTRVIANPKGYFNENRRFDGKLVVGI